MSPVKFTRGPWHQVGFWVEHEHDDVADICLCDPEDLGQGHLKRSADECIANARLIAAAPDLFLAAVAARSALLKFLVARDPSGYAYALRLLRGAIKKAEGRR